MTPTTHLLAALRALFTLAALLTGGAAHAQANPITSWTEVLASHVACEDPAGCPAHVGAMVTLTANGTSFMCAVTLIAPDLVLTAHHCLTQARPQADAPCYTSRVFFPASGRHDEEQAGCLEVVQASPPSVWEPNIMREDVAVLRLTRPLDRPPARLSNAGLDDGERVSVYYPVDRSVNLQTSTYELVLRNQTCTAVHGSVFAPRVDGPTRLTQTLGGCSTPMGSSGAGVTDARGRVAAVLEGGISYRGNQSERLAAFSDHYLGGLPFALRQMVAVDTVPGFTSATNLACVSIDAVRFERNIYAHLTCAPDGTIYRTAQDLERDRLSFVRGFAERVQAQRDQAEADTELYMLGLTDQVEWDLVFDVEPGRYHVGVSPLCRRPHGPTPGHAYVPTTVIQSAIGADSRLEVTTERSERRVSLRALPRCT